jgi:hypothetical protein
MCLVKGGHGERKSISEFDRCPTSALSPRIDNEDAEELMCDSEGQELGFKMTKGPQIEASKMETKRDFWVSIG